MLDVDGRILCPLTLRGATAHRVYKQAVAEDDAYVKLIIDRHIGIISKSTFSIIVSSEHEPHLDHPKPIPDVEIDF